MTPAGRLTLPEIPWHLFESYYRKNPTWGTLHVVLDDDNLEDDFIKHCRNQAIDGWSHFGHVYPPDLDAVPLCDCLLHLTKTQRSKIGYHVFRKVDRGIPYPWESNGNSGTAILDDTAKAPGDTGR